MGEQWRGAKAGQCRDRAGGEHHRPRGGDVAAGTPGIAGDVEADRGRLAGAARHEQQPEPRSDGGVLAANRGPERTGHDDACQRGGRGGRDVEAGCPGDHRADAVVVAQGRPGGSQLRREGVGAQRPAAVGGVAYGTEAAASVPLMTLAAG